MDGKLWQVTEYHHIKMKRTALAKVKMRDIEGGHTIEQSFQSDQKFTRARLDHQNMQYLYQDGNIYYFMDEETYEQTPIDAENLGDAVNYLKENITVQVSSYKDRLVGVEIPLNVELAVTTTDPGFKGDTVTGGTKAAVLETGVTVQVPLFINEGDVIKVDTRDGSYIERVNQ